MAVGTGEPLDTLVEEVVLPNFPHILRRFLSDESVAEFCTETLSRRRPPEKRGS